MHEIHGEPSFHLTTPELELAVTARGGHMAPVVFHLPGRDVSPYSISPWEPGSYPNLPPLLSVLRGDFFCLPFGGQPDGPPHGETANFIWQETGSDERSIRLAIETTDTGARVEKSLTTRAGHHAIYIENKIFNLAGKFSYGTHPVLDFSRLPEGTGRVTTSTFHWASVFPGAFSDPAAGESQALMESSRFTDLREVALAAGGTTDLSRYPARPGNDDLVMMAHIPTTPGQPFAWSAAILDGYVWFSLKNPTDFPCTVLWISNGGRSAEPWNTRHIARLGIEDVCSHFSDGYEKSRLDLLASDGVPTTRDFRREEIVSLRNIHAVAPWPAQFGSVASITPDGENQVRLTGEGGEYCLVSVDWNYLRNAPLG